MSKKPVSKAKSNSNVTKTGKDSAVTAAVQTAASVTETKAAESLTAKETAEVKKEEPAIASSTEEKTVSKVEEKPVERKRPGRKPGSKNRNTVVKKQPAAKRAEKDMVQEVFFEYNGEQVLSNELIDRIKEEYKNEGHRISSIKTLQVYINLEHRKAYYVINGKGEGKFVEF